MFYADVFRCKHLFSDIESTKFLVVESTVDRQGKPNAESCVNGVRNKSVGRGWAVFLIEAQL
jgi:hypothetical protein